MSEWSSPPERGISRRGPWAEKARRLPSLVVMRGCPSESAIPEVFWVNGGPEELEILRECCRCWTSDSHGCGSNTVGSISHFGNCTRPARARDQQLSAAAQHAQANSHLYLSSEFVTASGY